MAGKKKNKSELSETKRHFGVILEHIDSKVKLVLEGHRGLEIGFNKKFDQVNEKLEMMGGQLNAHSSILKEHGSILKEHSSILKEHSGILKEHSNILNAHTEMIGSMKADIEVIKIDSAFIKNSLKQKVGLDEFAVLEKRVAMLERKLQRT